MDKIIILGHRYYYYYYAEAHFYRVTRNRHNRNIDPRLVLMDGDDYSIFTLNNERVFFFLLLSKTQNQARLHRIARRIDHE